MAHFIEIPLFLKENDPDIDYDALGIDGNEPVDAYDSLLNIDGIQRVNTTDHPEANCVIWMKDRYCYYSSVTKEELKQLIKQVGCSIIELDPV